MKNKLLIIAIIAIIGFGVLSCLDITDDDSKDYDYSKDYNYIDEDNGKITILKYKGAGGNITVPSKIGGKTVTSIGGGAFYDCTSLASVTIPNSVTSIGPRTFFNCKNLTSVTIPDSVTSIGNYAFDFCTSLTSVTIPDSVTSIVWGAFDCCTSLASVTIGNNVTSIGNFAFSGCTSLTSITIPSSVTSIEFHAFVNCTSLTSVTFATGSNITNFSDGAFPEGYYGNDGNYLKTAYSTGKAGTYSRSEYGYNWAKQD